MKLALNKTGDDFKFYDQFSERKKTDGDGWKHEKTE